MEQPDRFEGKVLFHVLAGSRRIVIWEMDYEGRHEVYDYRGDGGEIWPDYPRYEPILTAWLSQYVGRPLSSPFGDRVVTPGSREYPRVLALNLTSDEVLNVWAYTTVVDFVVSLSQVARAVGSGVSAVERRVEEAGGGVFKRDGTRMIRLARVDRVFGKEVGARVILYSRQVAGFLGVRPDSVPDIVRRLGIGVPGRSQVGVPWGTLRRVRRVGPRTFVVRERT